MAICTFYQRNACRYGDNCKNEHPGSQRDSNRGFGGRGGGFGGGSNNNRFGAFAGDSYRPGQQSGGAFGRNAGPRYHLDREVIKTDLTIDRPSYPISCYGPGRDAPRQLIEGPVEVSPEELRSRYYLARRSGNESVAQEEQVQLASKMDAQVKAILDDPNGAIKYVEDGADVHPNRIDIAEGKAPAAPNNSNNNTATSNPFSQQSSNPFGGGAHSQTPAFGQTSTPAFGRPAGSTSTFGQPSNPGQTTSTFGQPSNPGQTTSTFGQSSALGGASAFGKPSMPGASTFGQPAAPGAFGSTAFGKPSMPGAGAAFGQTSAPGQQSAFGQTSTPGQQSAFGQPSAPGASSAFGKPSLPGQTSAFGQASSLGQNNAFPKPAFGQSGFGQTSQPGATTSPFGQQQQQQSQPQANKPNPFQSNNQPSPFGQQAQTAASSNPFGQTQQQAPAQSNPFGQASAGNPSPFAAQNSAPATQSTNAFGTKTDAPAFGAKPSPFQPSSTPFAQPQQAQASPFAQQANANPPAMAGVASNSIEPRDRYKEGSPEEYEGEKGKILEEIYKRVSQLGIFPENEEIPLTPPKCEWITPVSAL
ncbi:hypothetical protein DM02DRAFT_609275 [Periconia macrospinosa]|uniref:C3H1-type domain-containing protein n=1 Tax=Periconia macrospinosa TaxID=97972 RepID=A0A2V1E8L9_9PLEO|nr:hypothetical protein DM02DRAFT_609275 [Periconia macrospinosa]